MKASLVILAIISSAFAESYPSQPSTEKLIANGEQDRKVNAPHYAESSVSVAVTDTADRLPPGQEINASKVTNVRLLPAHPVATLAKLSPSRSLTHIVPMAVDPFRLKLEFIWEKPHGQWMNQLLKDIETAKKAGDMETYNTLTARYSAWAEKYLRKDSKPKLDGNPSR